jgi:hypothetical protein
MSPFPEKENIKIEFASGVGAPASARFCQEYVQDLFAGPSNASRIGLNALECGGWGAAVGGLTGAGLGVGGFKVASGLNYMIRPFMGSFAFQPSPVINYSRVALNFGLRGALAGTGVALLSYGLYEGYQYLTSKDNTGCW